MTKVSRNAEEDRLQADIIDLFKVGALPSVMWFSVPNGGFRDWKTAKTMKATGQTPGVTDIVVLDADNAAHFMEVKTKNGSLTKPQREFRDRCIAAGTPWCVVRSRAEAEAAMRDWRLLRPEFMGCAA